MSNADEPSFPTEEWSSMGQQVGMKPGLTKREYFMAHAPSAPDWFSPQMPEMPDKKYVVVSGKAILSPAMTSWEAQEKVQRTLQWPAYWADQMQKQLDHERT